MSIEARKPEAGSREPSDNGLFPRDGWMYPRLLIIETPEAYTARLLSLVGKDDAFRILATTPGRLLELMEAAH